MILITAIVIAGFFSCGPPGKQEVNKNLKEIGPSISKQAWSKAEEEIRLFSDDWMSIRSDYRKEHVKKVDELINKLEMNLAVSDRKKSLKNWRQLLRIWQQINH